MNELAAAASGDWIFVWNDDCLMLTEHWDTVISSYPLDQILSPNNPHKPLCTFPAVPRRFIEEIGHFALNCHTDTWWQEIGEWLEILTWIPVNVRHERADITGMNNDSVFQERVYQTEEFYDSDALEARRRDAQMIARLIGHTPSQEGTP
jgi:hypothetical protein